LYKDLPIIGAEKPSLKITLNKAIQLINARGIILGVQKKGRNVERQKKRKADEMEAKAIGSGNIRSRTAIALSSSLGAPGAPTVRLTRAAIARGEASLARGRGGARGRGRIG
jgi:DNA-binding GntR family transcriptional regulator